MAKPTQWSVTEEPCRCGLLQDEANKPNGPIVFDAATGEYQFEYTSRRVGGEEGKGHLIIYHCPLCGGAAPPSRRHLLFAVVPPDEQGRLMRLLEGIKTADEVIQTLGKADYDFPSGVTEEHPEGEGTAPTVRSYRTLTYTRMSEKADVVVTDYRERGLSVRLQGKYVGPPEAYSASSRGAPSA